MSDEPESTPPPDAAAVEVDALPRRRLRAINGQRRHGFQVVLRRKAYEQMLEHAHSTTDVEVCGVLAGNLFRDQFGPYLLISAALPGHAASQRGASVTFTADTWMSITERMEREHADRRVAGWYHTHPDFGVFLSEADIFIQRNFFDLPWQVAIVVDPVREETGNFVWRGGIPTAEPMVVEDDGSGTNWRDLHHREMSGEPVKPRRTKKVLSVALLTALGVAGAIGAWLAWHYLEI